MSATSSSVASSVATEELHTRYSHPEGPKLTRKQCVLGQNTEEVGCIYHSHPSLVDVKKGIADGSLDDDKLLDIFTQASEDLKSFQVLINGRGVFDARYSEKHVRPFNKKEEHIIHRAFDEDTFILEIVKRHLLTVNKTSGNG